MHTRTHPFTFSLMHVCARSKGSELACALARSFTRSNGREIASFLDVCACVRACEGGRKRVSDGEWKFPRLPLSSPCSQVSQSVTRPNESEGAPFLLLFLPSHTPAIVMRLCMRAYVRNVRSFVHASFFPVQKRMKKKKLALLFFA